MKCKILCSVQILCLQEVQALWLACKHVMSQVPWSVGLDIALVCKPGGPRFKSCSGNCFLVHPQIDLKLPGQFPLWFITLVIELVRTYMSWFVETLTKIQKQAALITKQTQTFVFCFLALIVKNLK